MSWANWVTASRAPSSPPPGNVGHGLAGDVEAEAAEHDQRCGVDDDFGLCPGVLLVVDSEGVDGLVNQRVQLRVGRDA
jgi:hypothetical protein